MSASSYRVVLRDLEQRRAVLAASLDQADSAIAALTALLGDQEDEAEATPPAKVRRARPTPAPPTEGLRARVLAALTSEPMTLAAVAEALGIKPEAARYQLAQLVDAGQAARQGKTSQTRYVRVGA